MTGKMDDARRASRERDARRKPWPEDMTKGDETTAGTRGAYRYLKKKGMHNTCPDCRNSVANMGWDPNRSLWVCRMCFGTWTQDELEYTQGKDTDD